jgi:uncharacterized membrane protein YhaH (DUF805 family)
MNSYLDVWKKFGDFSGRARRREYWTFFLINLIVGVCFICIDVFAGLYKEEIGLFPLYMVYSFAAFIPSLAVTARRLHDTNHSGWTMLLSALPIIGPIILLVWMVRDSDPAKNRYGPNPQLELIGVGDY